MFQFTQHRHDPLLQNTRTSVLALIVPLPPPGLFIVIIPLSAFITSTFYSETIIPIVVLYYL